MTPLPKLMVAPNGARKTKADHPAIPIKLDEIIATAVACHLAGVDGLHLHLRDDNGRHILDAGLYREALNELRLVVPEMTCQITTESVGLYTSAQQRKIVDAVQPESVSISLAEMFADGDVPKACRFYRRCALSEIAVQHILYDENDLHVMSGLLENGSITGNGLQLLFVLGRYSENQESSPDDLLLFTNWLGRLEIVPDWAVCAFGKQETMSLAQANRLGGKVRVGFENSFWNADGTIANSNCERVTEVKKFMKNRCVSSVGMSVRTGI